MLVTTLQIQTSGSLHVDDRSDIHTIYISQIETLDTRDELQEIQGIGLLLVPTDKKCKYDYWIDRDPRFVLHRDKTAQPDGYVDHWRSDGALVLLNLVLSDYSRKKQNSEQRGEDEKTSMVAGSDVPG